MKNGVVNPNVEDNLEAYTYEGHANMSISDLEDNRNDAEKRLDPHREFVILNNPI